MTTSKTYLNVPYADKDAAKALGARWDADKKKWYLPATVDLVPFAKWQLDAASMELLTDKSLNVTVPPSAPLKKSASTHNSAAGVFTYPTDKGFVAYNGDEPPWS
jgi:Domain of unknown function (DUF5710)